MIKFGAMLSWIFSIFFLIFSIFILTDKAALPSIPYFLITLLLLPPLRNFVYAKTKFKIPFYARTISIIVLIIISGYILEKKDLEYFSNNSASVLAKINTAIQSGDYATALSLSKKYLKSGNKELADLHRIAETKTNELEAERKKNSEKSDQFYSWASKVNKETCDKIATIGLKKGSRDRLVAIRDNNNIDFAYSFCAECSTAEKSEIATCYEIGYDRGYYGR